MKWIGLMLMAALSLSAQKKQEIEAVSVTLFERGEDTGNAPGEFQLWVEREKLTQNIAFQQGRRDLRTDGKGWLAMGMDPRFGVTKAYLVFLRRGLSCGALTEKEIV